MVKKWPSDWERDCLGRCIENLELSGPAKVARAANPLSEDYKEPQMRQVPYRTMLAFFRTCSYFPPRSQDQILGSHLSMTQLGKSRDSKGAVGSGHMSEIIRSLPGVDPEGSGSGRGGYKAGKGRDYQYETLFHGTRLNILARVPQKGYDTLLAWFLEAWKKQWPTLHEAKAPEIPRQVVKEGFRRDSDPGMPECLLSEHKPTR